MQLHYARKLPPWAWLCLPLTWGYALVLACRHGLYQLGVLPRVTVSVPVISVGNLTTGGTGKTPVVLALTKALLSHGLRVVVLSRGYGASQPQRYAQATSPAFGDEAYLLQQALPKAVVIVGANRSKNAKQAIKDHHPDVIVLDDGFQHWRLHRDVDIVLIDGQRGLGNGQLLPLGPLREPTSSLRRACHVWLTKLAGPALIQDDLLGTAVLRHVSGCVPFVPEGFHSLVTRQALAPLPVQTPCIVVSGIANPALLHAMVTQLGLLSLQQLVYPDHHAYTTADARHISLQLAQCSPETVIITTDKDADKLALVLSPLVLASTYSLGITAQLPKGFVEKTLLPLIKS
jgi:tetraacyldisaccharide 4'-kinase